MAARKSVALISTANIADLSSSEALGSWTRPQGMFPNHGVCSAQNTETFSFLGELSGTVAVREAHFCRS